MDAKGVIDTSGTLAVVQIVAGNDDPKVGKQFGDQITAARAKGLRLHSWQFTSVADSDGEVWDTIVALFERGL